MQYLRQDLCVIESFVGVSGWVPFVCLFVWQVLLLRYVQNKFIMWRSYLMLLNWLINWIERMRNKAVHLISCNPSRCSSYSQLILWFTKLTSFLIKAFKHLQKLLTVNEQIIPFWREWREVTRKFVQCTETTWLTVKHTHFVLLD